MKKTAIASAIALAATLPLSSVVMSQSDESMEVEEVIVSVSRRDVAVNGPISVRSSNSRRGVSATCF